MVNSTSFSKADRKKFIAAPQARLTLWRHMVSQDVYALKPKKMKKNLGMEKPWLLIQWLQAQPKRCSISASSNVVERFNLEATAVLAGRSHVHWALSSRANRDWAYTCRFYTCRFYTWLSVYLQSVYLQILKLQPGSEAHDVTQCDQFSHAQFP